MFDRISLGLRVIVYVAVLLGIVRLLYRMAKWRLSVGKIVKIGEPIVGDQNFALAQIEYTVQGIPITGKLAVEVCAYRDIGDEIMIKFNPKSPREFIVYEPGTWFSGVIFMIVLSWLLK